MILLRGPRRRRELLIDVLPEEEVGTSDPGLGVAEHGTDSEEAPAERGFSQRRDDHRRHVPLQQNDELVERPAGLVQRDGVGEQAPERPGVSAERPNVDRDARGHGDHKVKPVRRNQQQVAGLDVRYQDLGTGTVVNLTGLDCLVCARTATRF